MLSIFLSDWERYRIWKGGLWFKINRSMIVKKDRRISHWISARNLDVTNEFQLKRLYPDLLLLEVKNYDNQNSE